MAQFAPHYATFTTINRIRAFSNFLFWAIFVLSLLDLVLPHDKPELLSTKIFEIGQIVNIIFLISFFFSEGIVDLILVPISDNKRRDDFLDNSIGSNLSLRQSVAYYDNDEVTQGLYKVAVNLFENCFFTHSLTKKTHSPKNNRSCHSFDHNRCICFFWVQATTDIRLVIIAAPFFYYPSWCSSEALNTTKSIKPN